MTPIICRIIGHDFVAKIKHERLPTKEEKSLGAEKFVNTYWLQRPCCQRCGAENPAYGKEPK